LGDRQAHSSGNPQRRPGGLWKADSCHAVARIITKLRQRFQLFHIDADGQILLELGAGFSFIARQKRIQIDSDDYYIDLLFFNHKLKRLLAIDLKLGDFKPADKGQMELYLRWLDKYERQEDEQSPIGLVLCAGKKRETVELLALEDSGIRVAEYMTELPPRKVLEQKLHTAIEQAKRQFQNRLELQAGKENDEPTH
jgi:hypothetical protein